MEPSTTPIEGDDEWDTDGFVIPSLEIEEPNHNKTDSPKVEDFKLSKLQTAEEKIYFGPHGAPPFQAKQQKEQNPSSRKQKFKQKLKEADGKHRGTERENKVDSLRDLVGAGKMLVTSSNNSPKDWLDPHCHESQFERRNLH